jgi:hypothetical protein
LAADVDIVPRASGSILVTTTLSQEPTPMNPHARKYDPIRFHRGARGFAAFLAGLNGFVLVGLAFVVAPTFALDQVAASWLVILAGAAGLAHFVAAVGLIRGRAWSGALVGYLAAAGITVAAITALLAGVGVEIFGAEPRTTVGFGIWMIGTWLVATRFALKPFTYERPARFQARRRMPPPAPDTRPQTGLRKARPVWSAPAA